MHPFHVEVSTMHPELRKTGDCGERTCETCALTQGGLHTSCGIALTVPMGAGGLLQVGGPVADALWLQGFGVELRTLCLFVGGKQKKETKITISTRKKNEHCMPSSSRVHRTETHTVLRVQPHPFTNLAPVPLFPAPSATHPAAALGRLGVRVTNQPTWCWARCSSAVRGLPRGQVPGTLGGTGTSVGYYGEPGVLRDHGGVAAPCLHTCSFFNIQAPECTQTRGSCDMDEGKPHEERGFVMLPPRRSCGRTMPNSCRLPRRSQA